MTCKYGGDGAQFGDSPTVAYNFVLSASAANGTSKYSRGILGATTQDIWTVNAAGVVDFPQGITQGVGVATPKMLLSPVQTLTGLTLADFAAPSWARKGSLLLDNVSLSGTDNLLIQLGRGGIVETTSYVGSSALLQNGSSVSVSAYTAGFGILTALAANNHQGIIQLILQDTATNKWVCAGTLGVTTTLLNATTTGVRALASALDKIRLTVTAANTFDGGTAAVLWEGY